MLQLEATGKVRILATFGPQRAPELPTVPTAIELGLKVPEAQGWGGIYAPANTPQARIDQLNAAIVKALHEPDLKERLNKMGMQPAGR